jgi:hypothetical protein
MNSARRPLRAVSMLLGLATAMVLGVGSVAPAQAATNPTLGILDPANPAANPYSGCVAAVLTGSGVVFGSSAALGSGLASLWPTLPSAVTAACRQAVDSKQPQVCVSPADPATCPAIGASAAKAIAVQAASGPGTWTIVDDGLGFGGYAETPLASSSPARTPMATVTGTFSTPSYICTTSDCSSLPPVGLFGNCGPASCGAVTSMTVSFVGRTPNDENGVPATVRAVDGFGNVTTTAGIYGMPYQGTGCGTSPVDCTFSSRLTWFCKDAAGAEANCGGQTLTVAFTYVSGPGGDCGCAAPAPALAQQVEMQLATDNLDWHQNPTVCGSLQDCLRYDDPRLRYFDGASQQTIVRYVSATLPSAVIDLAPASLDCLVGVNVTQSGLAACIDVTGATAPLLQDAHAPVVPARPPTITASTSPAGGPGGWQSSPVTVSLVASDESGPGVKSISYSSTGAQNTPDTTVEGASAQVVISTDGITTVSFRATDTAGTSSDPQTLTVQVDGSAPAVACAPSDAAWHAENVSTACSASDLPSGLADPSQAQLALSTSVPAATETETAATGTATVCDVAGNCATAGPVTGFKIDRKAPAITITAPTGAYSIGQEVVAAYSCSDGGSGIAACTGTVAAGAPVDTSSAGVHTFTVDAADLVGNHSQQVASYTVAAGYSICPASVDSTEQPRDGYWHWGPFQAVQFSVCGPHGENLSSVNLAVTATGFVQVATGRVLPVPSVGGSTAFIYSSYRHSYSMTLSTRGLASGTYKLTFTIGSDPTVRFLLVIVASDDDTGYTSR